MKISKLFHWLYAFVMFLPIFAIGVTCGYAMFNKNAYKSYYGVDINNYELTTVTSLSDLHTGNKYKFRSTNITEQITNSNNQRIYFSELSNISTSQNFNTSVLSTANSFYYSYYTSNFIVFCEDNTELGALNITNYALNFEFIYEENTYVNNNFNYVTNTLYEFVYMETSFISEVFYYSVDKVTQSSLFSWSYDSFLVAPFSYIVNLFGMPTNSVIVDLLSYWLAISIIWLVFDLVMYVPLLVHRWLDKGVLE